MSPSFCGISVALELRVGERFSADMLGAFTDSMIME